MAEQQKDRKTVKEPLRYPKVAKVPVVMQMEALECGAASLTMVLAYYGKWIPLEQVRLDCGVSRDGSNLKNIYLAAVSYGLEPQGYRMDIKSLRENGTFPCIIHWNFNHFVVLDGFKKEKAIINDPARGRVEVSEEEFDKAFTGVVLTFVPTEEFEPSGKRKSTLEFAARRLRGAGPAVAFVVMTSIIVIVVMSLLAAFQIIVEWARVTYSLKINGKMAIEGNASYMWKVLRLPIEFFSQRMTGDIMQRQYTNASIASTLVGQVAPLVLNIFMMIFYLVVMIRYSPAMTLVGITSLLLNMLVARYMSEKRVNLTRVLMRDEGKLVSATLAGISMTETIKSSGAEEGFFRRWAGYQASVNTQNVKYATLNAKIGWIPSFISSLSNYAVMFMGIMLAMNDNFTVGMITTFQGLLASFMGPAQTMISAGQLIQEMRTQMERVDDVMEYPDDPMIKDEEVRDDISYAKLLGDIEIKNLTFGYSRLGNPVISDFSAHIKPGSRVAIVGSSGSGKSTVSKLVTGLYQPWEGEILFDGKPMEAYPRAVITGSIAMVDQDIVLFEDTIENNIRMWDSSIEKFEIVLAARDAQIHDDILQRPGGYQYRLIENGRDLSGGQRQRLEIARALAQDPSIIILDEATSALDAKTEYELVKAVKDRGISCIVIAHRLSTIRDCDEIIVLEKGKIVERGTHDELYARGGAYTELVTSE